MTSVVGTSCQCESYTPSSPHILATSTIHIIITVTVSRLSHGDIWLSRSMATDADRSNRNPDSQADSSLCQMSNDKGSNSQPLSTTVPVAVHWADNCQIITITQCNVIHNLVHACVQSCMPTYILLTSGYQSPTGVNEQVNRTSS